MSAGQFFIKSQVVREMVRLSPLGHSFTCDQARASHMPTFDVM